MPVRRAAVLALLVLLALAQATSAASPVIVRHGPRHVPTIALTIDDGWSAPRCGQMYETLVATGVPATWFPNAVYVKRAPALWRRIAARFPIGNHTYSHPDLTRLSSTQIRDQLVRDQRVIEAITGQPMAMLLRPPFGALDHRVRRVAHELGYDTLVLWDTSDADSSPRTTLRGGLRAGSRGISGSIVLMHCGPAVTPAILPALIRHYACAGYRFVTVAGLLARDPGVKANVDCTLPSVTDAAGSPPPPSGSSAQDGHATDPGPTRPTGTSAQGAPAPDEVTVLLDDLVHLLTGLLER